jgi:hypothetical protein
MTRRVRFLPPLACLLLALGAGLVGLPRGAYAQCTGTLTSTGIEPLNDLGAGLYLSGHAGGLYPGGLDTRPPEHLAAGIDRAERLVVPRRGGGEADPAGGAIGLIAVGMSNTSQEFSVFLSRANADPARNPQLVIVNGAQGGRAAEDWAGSEAPWEVLAARVAGAGLTALQVQVVWMKHANRMPSRLGAFEAHARSLQADLEAILRRLKAEYPNLRLAFLSSRTRAYTAAAGGLNPEPYAYESGFAVRWTIEGQLGGREDLSYATEAAPWLSWGPYLWIDGERPRSDGLTWQAADLQNDCTHPSASGSRKVADQLLTFFKCDPAAAPWFLRRTQPGDEPAVTATPASVSGPAPLMVAFAAAAVAARPERSIIEFAWSFDDGTGAFGAAAVKLFPAPGEYDVRLTVTDSAGSTARLSLAVTVTTAGEPGAPAILGPASPLPPAAAGEPFAARFSAAGTPPIIWRIVSGSPPPGLALDAGGVYSGTPLAAGLYGFLVEASNAAGADQRHYEHEVSKARGEPMRLRPIADAYVRGGSFARTNYGAEERLAVAASGTPEQNARSFLKFDLRGAEGKHCTRALLRLQAGALSGGGRLEVAVAPAADDAWSEAAVTWETMPAAGGELSVLEVVADGAEYVFEVTAAALSELEGDGVLSLAVIARSATEARVFFASREGSLETPVLELHCGGEAAARFLRGDANGDGRVDISDPVATLLALFLGGPGLQCADAGDANDDGAIDVADAIFGLNALFTGGRPPPEPFPDCGEDPTADGLGCAGGGCPP